MIRILIAHNAYQQRGGEDGVVDAEVNLLRERGHEVSEYQRHNDDLTAMNKFGALRQTLWSSRTVMDIAAKINKFKPDVIHVHNTFPLISPSIFWAAARADIPVVQTLHNFRLLCPQAMFLREQRVCNDCLGKSTWRAVVRKCYRDSIAQSAALSSMLTMHRLLGTYRHRVARYIALTEFSRNKFIEGGIPAKKISVKPNFISAPGGHAQKRRGGLFVGRMSPEKGIDLLLDALKRCVSVSIQAIGSGPEAHKLDGHRQVVVLGQRTPAEIFNAMQRAAFLVSPNMSYENFPRTLAEAYACGLPVIASRLGAMAELVEEGVTGLLFEPGNATDLAEKIQWAEAHPDVMEKMGCHARRVYEEKYTPEKNYQQMMAIYNQVIMRKST